MIQGGHWGECPPPWGPEKNGENVENEGEKRRKKGQSGETAEEKGRNRKIGRENFCNYLK